MIDLRHRFALWLQACWYGGKPPLFLLPLSALFAAVTAMRRWLYVRHIFKPIRLPVRVVVVGNLAVGGSGKTPLVAWLARELHQRDVKVGIVTRGYGRRERGIRRASTETPATAVGDEPRWLAAVTGVP
ncbi:MAG: tetraacyldisaccharide 4'-kinase, partial [Gammaproteobacteria bacterium]